ncbi:MAG: 30S ribosomal protein S9 [Bacilli bacterium]|nr:30S ribosomal protein S9 [Bacilli bacterium]
MDKKTIRTTGRRKSSVAQIKMTPGTGKITVNGKDVNEYLPFEVLVMDLKQPLVLTKTENQYDIDVVVRGGGYSGQTGAIRLGIAKALLIADENTDPTSENSFRRILKVEGMITRDPRIKERKKYGLRKARRAPQFSKR